MHVIFTVIKISDLDQIWMDEFEGPWADQNLQPKTICADKACKKQNLLKRPLVVSFKKPFQTVPTLRKVQRTTHAPE